MTEGTFYQYQFCHDIDEYCDRVREWDLDYHPLESGVFSSERLSFGNAGFIFSHTKIGRRLLQKGTTPKGLVTFGILANPDIKIHWRNADIKGDSLFIFPPGGELYSITPADFDVFPLSLNECKLNQVCTLLELPDFRVLTNNNEVFLCSPQKLFKFRRYLRNTEQLLLNDAESSRNIHFLREIEHVIAVSLVKILAESSQPKRRRVLRKRDKAIKKVETYIQQHRCAGITIPELCNIANVSQRLLEYTFRERYSMTPKAYLQSMQLNIVRKQLQRANPYENQVRQIAQQHGFTHMGRFGAYYKNLFGEYPSDTLRNKSHH